MERKFEQVLILAGKPVMRRPIPAAVVLDALPDACKVNRALCEEVRAFIRRYESDAAITSLQVDLTATSGDSNLVMPNAHGRTRQSAWQLSGNAFYQPNDYMLLNAGGIAYQGRSVPAGSYLSVGTEYAQLDIGYRDHWFSPLRDSSSLISTEAPTTASVTLSNYRPISPLNISYEIFATQLSEQKGIAYRDATTDGKPRLAGMQIVIEPVSGYSLGVNRLMQFGGGARSTGSSQFVDALFNNSNDADTTSSLEFGNQVAALTASYVVPGSTPFAINVEYSGEDNAWSGPYRLGATNLSFGMDFPRLFDRYNLNVEVSEWQNAWYVHHTYPQGLTNKKIVIGHWFGDARVFGLETFGKSASIQFGAQFDSGDSLQAKYRILDNENYTFQYKRQQELSLNYRSNRFKRNFDAELNIGRDVFGDSFGRLSLSTDLIPANKAIQYDSGGSNANPDVDYFVDAGVGITRAFQILARDINFEWTPTQTNYHFGLGVRRHVSKRNDVGMRLEFDEVANRSLVSLRAIDYRYRISPHVAVGGFFGVSRYEIFSLPAYGYYWGAGLQWIDILKGWDLGADWRRNDKMSRTKVKTSDPSQNDRVGIFVDTRGYLVYLSRHF